MAHIGKHIVGFLSRSFRFNPRGVHMADLFGVNCSCDTLCN